MKHATKKLLALALAVVMVLSSLSGLTVTAQAEEPPVAQAVAVNVGASTTITDDTGNYQDDVDRTALDESVAAVTVTGTATHTADSTAVTEAFESGTYLIVSTPASKTMTDGTASQGAEAGIMQGMALNGTTAAFEANAVWTITKHDDGTSTIQNAAGKYLTIAANNVTLEDTPAPLWIKWNNGNWVIRTTQEHTQGTTLYLNNAAGKGTCASGYASPETGANSQWKLYPVTSSGSTTIVIDGRKAGETSVRVGPTVYEISVTAEAQTTTEAVAVNVGESTTITDSTGNYQDDVDRTNLDESVAAVTVTGADTYTAGSTAVTAAFESGTYLIVSASASKTMTDVPAEHEAQGHFAGFALNGTTDAFGANAVWTITKHDDGTSTIQNAAGKYLTIAANNVTLEDAPAPLWIKWNNGSWVIRTTQGHTQGTTVYLNNAGGGHICASGYASAETGTHSQWKLYAVTASPATTIVIQGLKAGEASVRVGPKVYEISVTGEAHTHTYSEPVFTWNGVESATATFTCTGCTAETEGHTHTVEAVITTETTAGDCVNAAVTTYTATVTFQEAAYTDSVEVTGVTGDHVYNAQGYCTGCGAFEPAYLVSEDNYAELGLDESYIAYYAMENPGQLYWFAAMVNGPKLNTSGQQVKSSGVLLADIDLSVDGEQGVWYPIGFYNDPWDAAGSLTPAMAQYGGIGVVFDGRGHTVSNFRTVGRNSQGLFGYAQYATIKNLGVRNATVSSWNAGAIVGYFYNGTVENCFAIDCNITASTTNTSATKLSAGAICGSIYGTVKNSYAVNCTVSYGEGMTRPATLGPIGGLTVENCCYYNVTAENGTLREPSATLEEIGMTLDQFASGEVAYLLNGSSSEDSVVWRQTLTEDAYPAFQGPIVYAAYTTCDETVPCTYTNDASAAGSRPDHTWVDATCTAPRTCSVCHITEGEATGHTHAEPVVENETAATCTTDGSYDTVVYCSVCNAELSRETTVVPATGHTFGDWTVTTEPTCTESGAETRTCECGVTETRELPALGHSYEAVVTAPTCTEDGYTTYTCTVCGDSYVSDEVAALGHNYVNGVCTVCSAEKDATFIDVPVGEFYFDAVEWAVTEGITTVETTFDPNGSLLRAQVVTMLWRHAGEPVPTIANPFVDVHKDDFFYNAVLWALEEGITTGISDDQFNPTGVTNRAQALTFLWRYLGEPASTATNDFTDVEKGMWYEAPINWAVENNVTTGMMDGTFGIMVNCNRAHIVTFMYRALVK